MSDGNSFPFVDPLHGRQGLALKRQIQNAARRPPDSRGGVLPDVLLLLNSPEPNPKTWTLSAPRRRRPRGASPARTSVRHLTRPRLRYFAAVHPARGVRILLLTCGAKGTRTPDPLLANNRQDVHRRPQPQIRVPAGACTSIRVPACCGTSVLYFRRPEQDGFVILRIAEQSAPYWLPQRRPGPWRHTGTDAQSSARLSSLRRPPIARAAREQSVCRAEYRRAS